MSSQTDILLNVPGPGGTPIFELPAPQATTPASQIDPTLPVYGNPTTQSVRQNFATAQVEITGLMQLTQGAPFLPTAGGHMTGPMYLYNDPTDVMMPVTLGYFNAHGGGGSGAGGIPEAPADTNTYGRNQGAWIAVLARAGGTANQMTGELWLAGNPTDPLGAVPKQYADAIATTANGAVQRAGDVMTGLLILSGDPSAPFGAVTKQYADAGLALKSPINNPTFTGTVITTGGRVIIEDPTSPTLTLYNTTSGQPVYGIYDSGGYLGFGLATPAGAPNGAPFATMDQSGNFLFATRVNVTGGRLISSSGTVGPSLTLNYTTSGAIFGLWNGGNNVLNFGICDATGAPQSSQMTMNNTGSLNVNGNLYSATASFQGPSFSLNCQSGTVHLDNGAGANFSGTILLASGVVQMGYGGGGQINANNIVLNSSFGVNYKAIDPNWIAWQWDNANNHLSLYVNGSYLFNIPPSNSDRRLKRDIAAPTVDALATIKNVTLQQFDMQYPKLSPPLDDDTPMPDSPVVHWDMGFMSDQLHELIPSAVTLGDDEKFDTVNQLPLMAYAFGAIQQLLARVEALEGKR